MFERYVYKNQQKLRCGYTTGTCAAAAARAAAQMLLSDTVVEEVRVQTPSGISLTLAVEDIERDGDSVSCAIRKDSGDDPDVTNGMLIYARVSYIDNYTETNMENNIENNTEDNTENRNNIENNTENNIENNIGNSIGKSACNSAIIIDGGKGIGRITKKGLSRPVGSAAINPVPLEMIESAVKQTAEDYCYSGKLKVIISAPEGEQIAAKTFNPNLGIVGGISILGTTGIVEPMSEQALIDTIRTDISMHIAEGERTLLIAPGNYGQDFLLNTLHIELKRSIKCSNYIGNTIDMVCESGADGMLLVGHIGKLVKLGAGIMNTHSRTADGRIEVLVACAIQAGADADIARQLLTCVTTDAALEILKKSDILQNTMQQLMFRIEKVLDRRSEGKIKIAAIVFSNEYGILGKTSLADELLEDVRKQ